MNSTRALESITTESRPLIDTYVYNFFLALNLLVISPVVGVFGIVANIINIVNFRRQGYQDGINVTLTALSISDIGSLVIQMIANMIYNPWLSQNDLIAVKVHITSFIYYIHGYFTRVSGLITSFAAFERCLCVVLPLMVKRLVTKRVAIIINTSMFILLSLYMFPPNAIIYIDWKFFPEYNRSLLSVYFKDNRESYMKVYYYIAELFLPYATICFLTVYTSILIKKLKENSLWRQSASSAVNYKERKIVVMLSTISIVFVVCTIPPTGLNTSIGIIRDLATDRPLYYLFLFCYAFGVVLETINSSVSIIIYFKMSTKYRREFYCMMSCLKGLAPLL